MKPLLLAGTALAGLAFSPGAALAAEKPGVLDTYADIAEATYQDTA